MLYGKMESFDYTFYLIQSIHEPGSYNYVGSTRDLTKRKYVHKTNCNNESCNTKLYQMMRQNGGWDAFEFIELEYHHYTEQQAHEYEQQLIEQIQPTMNSVRAWTGLSKIEYIKQYNIDNAEKMKQYRIDNAEHIKQRKKQYNIDNAEHIKQHRQQYYIDNAEKRKQYNIDNAEHIKQYRIDNAEKMKQYRIDNAEEIKQQRKQYRIDNAEELNQKHTCECGGSYTTSNKSIHEKSKKHLTWILGHNHKN
jgi:hypothetical protein